MILLKKLSVLPIIGGMEIKMKKITIFCAALLLLAVFLGSCAPTGLIGNEKTFDDAAYSIKMHDKISEQRDTSLGFYNSYLAPDDGYGVVVYKDAFADELGLENMTLADYFNRKEPNADNMEISVRENGDIKCWVTVSETTYTNMYCFKGADGFYRFRFFCYPQMVEEMLPYFDAWAQSIVIK